MAENVGKNILIRALDKSDQGLVEDVKKLTGHRAASRAVIAGLRRMMLIEEQYKRLKSDHDRLWQLASSLGAAMLRRDDLTKALDEQNEHIDNKLRQLQEELRIR